MHIRVATRTKVSKLGQLFRSNIFCEKKTMNALIQLQRENIFKWKYVKEHLLKVDLRQEHYFLMMYSFSLYLISNSVN